MKKRTRMRRSRDYSVAVTCTIYVSTTAASDLEAEKQARSEVASLGVDPDNIQEVDVFEVGP